MGTVIKILILILVIAIVLLYVGFVFIAIRDTRKVNEEIEEIARDIKRKHEAMEDDVK